MLKKVFTIGCMGKTGEEFFESLRSAGVDTVVDIRKVCGSRGSKYAFANKGRLEKTLHEMGKRYVIIKEFAPSQGLLDLQHKIDEDRGDTTLTRTQLSPEYIERFKKENLEKFDVEKFLDDIGRDAEYIALLCFEPDPNACHRSLAAKFLQEKIKSVEIADL